jgi:hypothetical protein
MWIRACLEGKEKEGAPDTLLHPNIQMARLFGGHLSPTIHLPF